MADQQQPTGQQAPGLALQQLQAANYYGNMPLESPLFLPIMPVSGRPFKQSKRGLGLDLDCLPPATLLGRRWSHHQPQVSSISSHRCFRATQLGR
jgi:hypothetical protein